MRCDPMNVRRNPRNTDRVPNVTIRVGRRQITTKNPLIAPRNAPIPMEIAKMKYHGMSGITAKVNTVVEYMANTAMAVKLTSIPPEINTIIAATARMPMTTDARIRSVSVVTDKKSGSEKVARIQNAMITTATNVSFFVARAFKEGMFMMPALPQVRFRSSLLP